MGRVPNQGPNVNLLKSLDIGDSILVPITPTPAAVMQTARNKFTNPAKRLGIKLSFSLEGESSIRVKRLQ